MLKFLQRGSTLNGHSIIQLLCWLILALLLVSCSSDKQNQYTKVQMAVPFHFHPSLDITVLNYKLIANKEDLPRMSIPSKDTKYIAVRLMITNPGQDRSKPSVVFSDAVESIYLMHPSFRFTKGIKFHIDSMAESLERYAYGERGIAIYALKPGESKTGWIVASIHKDLTPPFVLNFTPSYKLKPPGKPTAVQLDN